MIRLLAALYRASPIGTSALLHGAVVVIVGAGHGGGRARPAPGPAELQIEVDTSAVETPADIPAATEDAKAAGQAAIPPTHHHDYPVPPDHDAKPHDPSLVHLPGAPAPALAQAPATEPARFVMPSSTGAAGQSGTHSARTATGSGSGDTTAAAVTSSNETFSESRVSVRARLAHAGPVAYPSEAREADLEADVPVEIVVDAGGRVIEARAVGRTGHGFDEAAVQAVRGYRFSPAQREGQSVRVRMRWAVHFRLR